MQELFKISTIEDTITCRARVIDHKFVFDGRGFSTSSFRLIREENKRKSAMREPTEKLTQQSDAGTDHLENESRS